MTRSWTSGLSVDGFAALQAVGFDPVGQVMGCTVDRVAWLGWGNCGGPVRDSAGGFSAYVRALKEIRHRALDRLLAEARVLEADGVVDVTVQLVPFPGVADSVELQLLGTAVRARGRRRPPRPFVAALRAPDVASLLLRGWVPVGLAFGVAVEVAHDDVLWGRRFDNVELSHGTALVHEVRAKVRHDLQVDVVRLGGAGVVVLPSTLELREQECGQYGGHDHVATATTFGTVIAPFRRREAVPRTLTFLPLGQGRQHVLHPPSGRES